MIFSKEEFRKTKREMSLFAVSGIIFLGYDKQFLFISIFMISWAIILLTSLILDFSGYSAEKFSKRNIYFGYLVSHHMFISIGLNTFIATLLVIAVINLFIIDDSIPYHLWFLLVPLLAIIGITARGYFTNKLIKIFKSVIGKSRKTIIFRHFSQLEGQITKHFVAPILGAYGECIILNDSNFEKVIDGPSYDSARIVGNLNETITFPDEEWKSEVTKLIGATDYSVFLWNILPTDSMLWEFNASKQKLRDTSLIFITTPDFSCDLKSWLVNTDSRDVVIIEFNSKIGYISPYRYLAKEIRNALLKDLKSTANRNLLRKI